MNTFKGISKKQLTDILEKEFMLLIDEFSKLNTGFLFANTNIIGEKKYQGEKISSLSKLSLENNRVIVSFYQKVNLRELSKQLSIDPDFQDVKIEANDNLILTYPIITKSRKDLAIEKITKISQNYKVKLQNSRNKLKKDIDLNDSKEEKQIHNKILDEVFRKYQNMLNLKLNEKILVINKL